MATDALGWRALVNRWVAKMAGCAIERCVRAIQRPRVHECRWHPGLVAVATSARVWKTFVRRVEGMLNVVCMAHDAVRAPNLDASVILRLAAARGSG